MKDKVIVALDQLTRSEALKIAAALQGHVWGFKVNDLLIECGVEIVRELKRFGNVFVDPKLHDIPNTVANGIRRLSDAGADLITVHSSGGRKMLQAAVGACGNSKILAVTALTSLEAADTTEIYHRSPEQTVLDFASLAKFCGVHGVVCSPLELPALGAKPELDSLLKVTPGVRPASYGKVDDQNRTATPVAALAAGASLLVIGRPLTQFKDEPAKAIELLDVELGECA